MALPLSCRNSANLSFFSFHSGHVVKGEGDSQLVIVGLHSARTEFLSHHFDQLHIQFNLEGGNWLYSAAVSLLDFLQPSEDVLLVVVSDCYPLLFGFLFDIVVSRNIFLELLGLALCDGLVHFE